MVRRVAAVRRRRLRSAFGVAPWLSFLIVVAAVPTARAACCDVVKTDPEPAASTTVRVCEMDAPGACVEVLFEGTLQMGQSAHVCSDTGAIRYEEIDPASSEWGPPVGAICDGADVEL
jgi:hypothetical protein